MIFVAFDAEEFGRKGSEYFKPSPVNLDKIKLNLNLDMISHNDKGELYAAGTYKYPQLKNYIATTIPDLKSFLAMTIQDWQQMTG
ncbi:hypothetical protein CS542_08825 [Pedobacter sp. IW39]|nr:hypothetical protein CS542_08825 [Pedobacter sp. IW39]